MLCPELAQRLNTTTFDAWPAEKEVNAVSPPHAHSARTSSGTKSVHPERCLSDKPADAGYEPGIAFEIAGHLRNVPAAAKTAGQIAATLLRRLNVRQLARQANRSADYLSQPPLYIPTHQSARLHVICRSSRGTSTGV